MFPADVSDLSTLDEFVAASVDELGRIDIVVNNAGGSMPTALLDTSVRSFEEAFHFNVTTAFALSKAAIPHLLEHGHGSIVNISSAMGRLRDRGFVAYGTAKAGLAHMTRLMAADCAPKIRVNAIAVGSVATSALEIVLTNDAIRNEMVAKTPLQRLGEVDDIALGALVPRVRRVELRDREGHRDRRRPRGREPRHAHPRSLSASAPVALLLLPP